jgi:hypothetical protein
VLHMWIVTFEKCGHTRLLHWEPVHEWYWCLECTDMQQISDSISTAAVEADTSADETVEEEEEPTVWIRQPTLQERRELERVQRLIAKNG